MCGHSYIKWETIVVPNATGPIDRTPSGVTSTRGSSLPGPSADSSRTERVQSSRVQVVEQSLIESGFSQTAAATIARPQRASTLATYEDKWAKFCDWCH